MHAWPFGSAMDPSKPVDAALEEVGGPKTLCLREFDRRGATVVFVAVKAVEESKL